MSELRELPGEVAGIARDAAYVVVGLGVLGLQRAQVHRVELRNKLGTDLSLEDRLREVRETMVTSIQQIDEIVEGMVRFVETTLEPIEEQLPQTAREMAQRAHEQAQEIRAQIRERVVPAA